MPAHALNNNKIGRLFEFIPFLLCRLRDEVRNVPCTYKSRNDAAADLIHIYAFTKNFFRIQVRTYTILQHSLLTAFIRVQY